VDVILDGSNSTDPDDGIASYLWEQLGGPSVSLSSTTGAQPSFIAPDVGPDGESLTFQLTVTDNGGLQDTDTCIVNVSWENIPPAADAGADQTVSEGTTVTLDGSNSSDPDGSTASYQWTQTVGPSVTLSNSTSAQPTFVPPPVDIGGESLSFLLTVVDNGGLQDTDDAVITINDNGIIGFPNDVLPVISSTGENIGVKEESGGNFVALNPIDPSTVADTTNRPENLIYGLFDMQVKTDTVGGNVTLTFYLPTSAPDNYTWFKYSSTNGWLDFSANTVFNNTRDQITITMTDGGSGDDDGVVNGIIVDPSGPGTSAVDEVGDGGGCFFDTLRYQ